MNESTSTILTGFKSSQRENVKRNSNNPTIPGVPNKMTVPIKLIQDLWTGKRAILASTHIEVSNFREMTRFIVQYGVVSLEYSPRSREATSSSKRSISQSHDP